jgi:hypothetical protein
MTFQLTEHQVLPSPRWVLYASSLMLLSLGLAGGGCASGSSPKDTVACVWRRGDDGLTVKFAERLEYRIRATQGLILGDCQEGSSLIVRIPSSLRWSVVASEVEVFAEVNVSAPRLKSPITLRARCSENEINECADSIFDAALRAGEVGVVPGVKRVKKSQKRVKSKEGHVFSQHRKGSDAGSDSVCWWSSSGCRKLRMADPTGSESGRC